MIQLVRPTEEQKEQAVKFRQELIFLLSWQIQNGSVTAQMIAGAVFFALQSAVLSGAAACAVGFADCRSRSFSFSMLEVECHENLIGGR